MDYFSPWCFPSGILACFMRRRSRTRLCTWLNTYPCSLLERCGVYLRIVQTIALVRYGPQMLYACSCSAKHLSLPPFFSEEVLYETYFYAERIMNLSPLEDQRTGGVLMKLANMAVSVGVLASIFQRWSSRSVKRNGLKTRD